MNSKLKEFAREDLKIGLLKCNAGQQHLFKQMYSGGKLDMNINDVVDSIDDEKLSWAMEQVEKTLVNNKKIK